MRRLAAPLVLVIFATGACWSIGGEDELSEMQIRAQAGNVFIHRGDEVIDVGEEAVPLEVQDVVKTSGNGFAVMELQDEREVKLQPRGEIVVDSTRSIESQRGNVLVQADARTSVDFDGTLAVASGSSFRVDKGFGAARVGTYDGRVQINSPGQTPLTVKSLFEATVAAGDLPARPRPYRLDEQDAWDQDLLQEVVKLEDELDLLARGFSRQLGSDRPDLAYFKTLSGGKKVSFMSRFLKRRPIDLLIGFAVADNDRDGSLKESFKDAFDLYDRGATWGVTAAIMEVAPTSLVAQLEDVILGTGVVAAGGEAGDEPEFSVAAAAAAEEGGPGPGPGDAGPGEEGPGDPSEDEDDDDGEDKDGDEEPQEECDPTDAECVVRRAISPSPSPSDLLDGAVGKGGGGDGLL